MSAVSSVAFDADFRGQKNNQFWLFREIVGVTFRLGSETAVVARRDDWLASPKQSFRYEFHKNGTGWQ